MQVIKLLIYNMLMQVVAIDENQGTFISIVFSSMRVAV